MKVTETVKLMRPVRPVRRGATATEYLLIMAVIVLPLALLLPKFVWMVKTYGLRTTANMALPFP